MFVGHYAAAFALKGKEPSSSLAMLFLATQFVDILFFPFVLIGIESMSFVEGFSEANDFNLEYMPWTHGLLSSVLWAALIYALYKFVLAKNKAKANSIAWVMALGILSHWFADLLVHTPDLPIVYGEPKLGLGLWNNKMLTVVLEAVLLAGSLYYYLKRTSSTKKSGSWAAIAFTTFLILINYLNYYVLPPNHDMLGLTISALLSYFVFAGLAYWVDQKRA